MYALTHDIWRANSKINCVDVIFYPTRNGFDVLCHYLSVQRYIDEEYFYKSILLEGHLCQNGVIHVFCANLLTLYERLFLMLCKIWGFLFKKQKGTQSNGMWKLWSSRFRKYSEYRIHHTLALLFIFDIPSAPYSATGSSLAWRVSTRLDLFLFSLWFGPAGLWETRS